MTNITAAFDRIRQEIRRAEADFGRIPGSVSLLAVTKQRSVTDIRAAKACGLRHFAENYLQEAQAKINALNDPELTWHFIGPVQSNKTRQIGEQFHWVHSLDRVKVARRLHDARPDHLPPLNVCIQINISEESSKAGITSAELQAFINECSGLHKLRLRGLMALPEPSLDFEQQRAPFRRLKNLFDDARTLCPDLDTLSMGTTQDMRAAIAEGSTMVRIGTALFGPRS